MQLILNVAVIRESAKAYGQEAQSTGGVLLVFTPQLQELWTRRILGLAQK